MSQIYADFVSLKGGMPRALPRRVGAIRRRL
jgi:hypothetical protein